LLVLTCIEAALAFSPGLRTRTASRVNTADSRVGFPVTWTVARAGPDRGTDSITNGWRRLAAGAHRDRLPTSSQPRPTSRLPGPSVLPAQGPVPRRSSRASRPFHSRGSTNASGGSSATAPPSSAPARADRPDPTDGGLGYSDGHVDDDRFLGRPGDHHNGLVSGEGFSSRCGHNRGAPYLVARAASSRQRSAVLGAEDLTNVWPDTT